MHDGIVPVQLLMENHVSTVNPHGGGTPRPLQGDAAPSEGDAAAPSEGDAAADEASLVCLVEVFLIALPSLRSVTGNLSQALAQLA